MDKDNALTVDFYRPTLQDYWIGMIEEIASRPTGSTQFSGIKFLSDFVYSYPGEAFRGETGIDLNDFGYQNVKTKMSMLTRVYLDEQSIIAAREKLGNRAAQEFTSVVVNTQAGNKSSKSQGHCMAAIIITRNTKQKHSSYLRLSVMYRMTESIKKFSADLVFFKEILFPSILGENMADLTEVVFHFANISLSPLFFPILLDKVNLTEFIGKFKENPRVHNSILGVIRRDMEREEGFHAYRQRNLMQRVAHAAYSKHPEIKEEMIKIIMNSPSKSKPNNPYSKKGAQNEIIYADEP